MRRVPVGLLALMVGAPLSVSAQDEPNARVQGLLDVRYVNADTTASFLNGGLGKTRYGRAGDGRSSLFSVAQASLMVSASLAEQLSARFQLNLEAEGDRRQNRARVDLIQAFVSYRPELSRHVQLRTRLGVFFPPISLENTETFWTSPYTITASAINSWIGEEIRPTGAELSLVFKGDANELSLGGAAFGNDDPAGSLLAWRGWSLQDRQTGLSDRLPLAPIPAISPGGPFSQQAPYVQPFREIDGRLGYYARASYLNPRRFELRGLWYDNPARRTASDGSQYAWATRFGSAGLLANLPGSIDIVGQALQGRSEMGPGAVNIRFRAAFGLASVTRGRHRLSARYDAFRVDDLDTTPGDDNREKGSAWTFAYILEPRNTHRLALEVLRISSDRYVRPSLGLPLHSDELQVQLSFRVQF